MFVALAWGGPFILSLIAGRALGRRIRILFSSTSSLGALLHRGRPFSWPSSRSNTGSRQARAVVRAPILAPASFEAAANAVVRALKQRNSGIAEIVCLGLAIAGTFAWLAKLIGADSSTWAVQVAEDGAHMTLEGWWWVVCSAPLFYFLLFRGLWRYIVWAMLLWRIASLELRLVATHPDGKGALPFSPNIRTPIRCSCSA